MIKLRNVTPGSILWKIPTTSGVVCGGTLDTGRIRTSTLPPVPPTSLGINFPHSLTMGRIRRTGTESNGLGFQCSVVPFLLACNLHSFQSGNSVSQSPLPLTNSPRDPVDK